MAMTKKITEVPYKQFIRNLVSSAEARARKDGMPFDITPEYIEQLWDLQDGRCALTGDRMTRYEGHGKNSIIESNASLDRIQSLDSRGRKNGYTQGDVQLVTWEANRMKGQMDYKSFVSACKTIIQNEREYLGTLLPRIQQMHVA